jgi:preprotein translocase subunit SecF
MNIIRFTRVRRWMYAFSITCILAGWTATYLRGGFNLGIDFTGGVTKDIQVLPRALSIGYEGPGKAEANLAQGSLTLTISEAGKPDRKLDFPLRNYPHIGDVVTALRFIDGVKVEPLSGSEALPSTLLVGFSAPEPVTAAGVTVDRLLSDNEKIFAPIDAVRAGLSALGRFSLQVIGSPRDQHYVVKLATPPEKDSAAFLAKVDQQITTGLDKRFPDADVLLKRTDFVGAVFSADLVRAAFWSVLVALILILIYVSVRFRFVYAAGAVLCLVHDSSFMLGFIGALQLEVTTSTVAAILTIIGYSLNDTIVVYDRMRENFGLRPQDDRALVIDTSITQTLSRTIITSLTTLLAVLAIFTIATGTIQNFALALLVGIIVGTYSSIAVAAPLVLGWQNHSDRRRREREGGYRGKQEAPRPSEAAR